MGGWMDRSLEYNHNALVGAGRKVSQREKTRNCWDGSHGRSAIFPVSFPEYAVGSLDHRASANGAADKSRDPRSNCQQSYGSGHLCA